MLARAAACLRSIYVPTVMPSLLLQIHPNHDCHGDARKVTLYSLLHSKSP